MTLFRSQVQSGRSLECMALRKWTKQTQTRLRIRVLGHGRRNIVDSEVAFSANMGVYGPKWTVILPN